MTNEIPSIATELVSGQFATSVLAKVYGHEYHELIEKPLVELNVLEQLKANLSQLEDLHGRLKFMMSELSYLMKKV